MNTLIISGGNIDSDFALDFIRNLKPNYIIAVDRGLLFAHEHQIVPNLIVGDFDSVPKEIIDEYREKQSVPIREYNPIKDATDTQIALEKALEADSDHIWLLGATGTRLDHVLGNIYSLKPVFEAGKKAYLVDKHNLITLVDQKIMIKKEEQYGQYISFLPLGEKVTGVCLTGFKYPLDHAVLTNDNSLGVSNEIVEPEAMVSMDDGIMIMIQSRD